MANQYERKTRRRKLLGLAAAVAAVAAVASAAAVSWGSVAKYVHEKEVEELVRAREFYFSSDYLKTDPMDSEAVHYVLNPSVREVSFELRAFEGSNAAEMDISYEITVDGGAVASSTSGSIDKGESITITLSGLEAGKTYNVIAMGYSVVENGLDGEKGYEKTLRARFEVADDTSGVYKNTSPTNEYVLLTVWTQGVGAENIEIKLPSGLIPDRTDGVLEKLSSGTFTLTLNANESRSFRFFKSNDYSNGTIGVTHEGKAVPETALN